MCFRYCFNLRTIVPLIGSLFENKYSLIVKYERYMKVYNTLLSTDFIFDISDHNNMKYM